MTMTGSIDLEERVPSDHPLGIKQSPDRHCLGGIVARVRAHRPTMWILLKYAVRTAVDVGAIDGTKVTASAAGDQTYTAAGLE